MILTPAKTPPALPVPSICRRCDRSSPTGERFSKTSPTLPATPPFPCSSEQKSRLLSTASYSRNRTPPTSLLPSPTREMALFTYPHPSNLIKCAQVNLGPVAQLARALHSHCRGRRFDSAQVHPSSIIFLNMPDITLTCQNCSNIFVFSEGEQQFYAQKGLTTPKLCPICRSIKQSEQKHPPKPKS